eukprot:820961-Alexandrium_andersonii.AAC.1
MAPPCRRSAPSDKAVLVLGAPPGRAGLGRRQALGVRRLQCPCTEAASGESQREARIGSHSSEPRAFFIWQADRHLVVVMSRLVHSDAWPPAEGGPC